MSTSTRSEAWKRVTKHDPCPICQKDHWCKVSPDGSIACCMFNFDQAYRIGQLKSGESYALHRLRDDRPYEPQPPTFTISTPEDDAGFDVLTARAVYAFTANHCAAEIPDFVRAELVRRFGPVYGPLAIERFGLGYCNSPQLVKALDAAGRCTEAMAGGVLHPKRGQAVQSLAGRITIPYRRGGGVLDLRGAGIKGRGETKEMSLPGGYVERDVAGLFFNHHDALDALPEGEPIHLAGGAYKTMALAMCELPAIGTRGEGELSDAQIAALVAAGVKELILHIDAEDAKEGQALSSGQRLGLPKGERIVAAGIRALVAEPVRAPGTAKVDPDAMLRDYGPRLVRAYATSAISFDAWRVAIGVDTSGVPQDIAEAQYALCRQLREKDHLISALSILKRAKPIKAVEPTAFAAAVVYASKKSRGQTDGDGWAATSRAELGDVGGRSADAAGNQLETLASWGVGFEKQNRYEDFRRVDEGGVVTVERRKRPYIRVNGDVADVLESLASFEPPKATEKNGEEKASWGGKRECPVCKSERRVTIVACADCGHEFHRTIGEPTPEPETVANISPCEAAPTSIPPTPVEVPETPATYPPGDLTYHRAPVALNRANGDTPGARARGLPRR